MNFSKGIDGMEDGKPYTMLDGPNDVEHLRTLMAKIDKRIRDRKRQQRKQKDSPQSPGTQENL